MMVIAEFTDSNRLRAFMETGIDGKRNEKLHSLSNLSYAGGERQRTHPPEWPRGLNQLGNTCYLNSLRESSS